MRTRKGNGSKRTEMEGMSGNVRQGMQGVNEKGLELRNGQDGEEKGMEAKGLKSREWREMLGRECRVCKGRDWKGMDRMEKKRNGRENME